MLLLLTMLRSSTVPALLAAVAFIYSTVYWSIIDPKMAIAQESWFAGVRLITGALVLTVIGSAVRTIGSHIVTETSHELRFLSFSRLSVVSRLIISLVAGEVACLVWIYLRAAVNGVVYSSIGWQLPITWIEVAILLVALVVVWFRSNRKRVSVEHTAARIWGVVGFLVLLGVSFMPVALRELPREIALSSDPDQHAFWVAQVLRLGGVPWDQGILGIGSFDYPAGFAALNAVWCLFSGLTPVEIVTVQPIIQSMLAAFLATVVGEIACVASARVVRSSRSLPTVVVGLALITAYWTVLPYGYQTTMYHGEGAGRAGTSCLMAIVVAGLIAISSAKLKRVERIAWVASLGLACTLIATINPLTALPPTLLVGSIIGYEVIRSIMGLFGRCRTAVGVVPLTSIGVVCAILLFGEPYIGEKIFALFVRTAGGEGVGVAGSPPPLPFELKLPPEPFLPWLHLSRLCALLFGENLPREFYTTFLYTTLGALYLAWALRAMRSALRCVFVLVALSSLHYLSLCIPGGGDVERPMYLVQPYVAHAIRQAGCVLGLILLAAGAHSVVRAMSAWGSIVALAVGLALTMTPDASLATHNHLFNLGPRRLYCGSMGCLTAVDREVVQFITDLGAGIVSKYSKLTYDEAPKILIPAHPVDLGREKWLFPSGVSRVLPLSSPLPVAFFYGRGSRQWSYENYRRHVCSQFDLEWLKRRNVRFLLLPAGRSGCIRGKERVIANSKILFERDGTWVLQLF